LLEQLEKIIIIKSQISKRNGPDHLFPMRSREGGNPNALGFSWAMLIQKNTSLQNKNQTKKLICAH